MLYEKKEILRFLLSKLYISPDFALSFGHVNSLKCIYDVNFSKNKSDEWICPVSGAVICKSLKCVVFVGCGHCVSLKSFQSIELNDEIKGCCIVCAKKYQKIVILNEKSLFDVQESNKARGLVTESLKRKREESESSLFENPEEKTKRRKTSVPEKVAKQIFL